MRQSWFTVIPMLWMRKQAERDYWVIVMLMNFIKMKRKKAN